MWTILEQARVQGKKLKVFFGNKLVLLAGSTLGLLALLLKQAITCAIAGLALWYAQNPITVGLLVFELATVLALVAALLDRERTVRVARRARRWLVQA